MPSKRYGSTETIPSQRYGSIEVVECPNCGSHSIKERWVEKHIKPVTRIVSMKDVVAQREPPNPYLVIGSAGVMPNLIQFVVSCDKCGFTEVRNFGKTEEKV